MVAQRVGNAEFGNIHQSTLSIPGVARKKGIKSRRITGGGDQSLNLHISSWNVGQVSAGLSPPSLFSTKTLSASARQTPACTGAAHRRRCGERQERRGQRKRWKQEVRQRGEAIRKSRWWTEQMQRREERARRWCERARAEEVRDGTESPLTVRGFFKCKGAWPATDGAAAIGCCRKGRSCKQASRRKDGWGGRGLAAGVQSFTQYWKTQTDRPPGETDGQMRSIYLEILSVYICSGWGSSWARRRSGSRPRAI